jgi:hypothetical protein
LERLTALEEGMRSLSDQFDQPRGAEFRPAPKRRRMRTGFVLGFVGSAIFGCAALLFLLVEPDQITHPDLTSLFTQARDLLLRRLQQAPVSVSPAVDGGHHYGLLGGAAIANAIPKF